MWHEDIGNIIYSLEQDEDTVNAVSYTHLGVTEQKVESITLLPGYNKKGEKEGLSLIHI